MRIRSKRRGKKSKRKVQIQNRRRDGGRRKREIRCTKLSISVLLVSPVTSPLPRKDRLISLARLPLFATFQIFVSLNFRYSIREPPFLFSASPISPLHLIIRRDLSSMSSIYQLPCQISTFFSYSPSYVSAKSPSPPLPHFPRPLCNNTTISATFQRPSPQIPYCLILVKPVLSSLPPLPTPSLSTPPDPPSPRPAQPSPRPAP